MAAGLLMMVLALLVGLTGPVLRSWVRSDKKASAQTRAALVVARVREELQGADPESIALLAPPLTGLVFVSNQDAQGQLSYHPRTAEMLFQKRVAIYWLSANKEVRYQETYDLDLDPMTPPEPLANVPDKLQTNWVDPARSDVRRLAPGVRLFEVAYGEGEPLRLNVETEMMDVVSRLETSILPTLKRPGGRQVNVQTNPP